MPYAEALKALGTERAMVVHGADGLDELTTTDVTYVATLKDGIVSRGEIAPEDAGLRRTRMADLQGGTAPENAEALKALFAGQHGAYRDIVLLNSAGALMVAGLAEDILSGMALARQALDSGAAKAKLFADDVRRAAGDDPAAQVQMALRRVTQRDASAKEVERGVGFLARLREAHGRSPAEALRDFCLRRLGQRLRHGHLPRHCRGYAPAFLFQRRLRAQSSCCRIVA